MEEVELLRLRNRILTNILREIKDISSCNRLGNSDVFLRKINELVSTAIK